jgi:hypothetical protein
MITINKTFSEYLNTICFWNDPVVLMARHLHNSNLSLENAGMEIKWYVNELNVIESTNIDDYLF